MRHSSTSLHAAPFSHNSSVFTHEPQHQYLHPSQQHRAPPTSPCQVLWPGTLGPPHGHPGNHLPPSAVSSTTHPVLQAGSDCSGSVGGKQSVSITITVCHDEIPFISVKTHWCRSCISCFKSLAPGPNPIFNYEYFLLKKKYQKCTRISMLIIIINNNMSFCIIIIGYFAYKNSNGSLYITHI